MSKKILEKIKSEKTSSDRGKTFSALRKTIALIFSAILILLIFLLLTYLFLEKKFENRIYPNVYLANIDLSGLDREVAQQLVDRKINTFIDQGIKIKLNNKEIVWHNLSSAFDPNLVVLPLVYNTDNAVSQAYLVARDGSCYEIFNKIKSFFFKTELSLNFVLNKEELKKIIKENFSDQEQPLQEVSLIFEKKLIEGREQIVFSLQEGRDGYEIDYDLFFSDLNKRLATLDNSDIKLKLVNKKPQIGIAEVESLPQLAQEVLKTAPLKLFSPEKKRTFIIEDTDLASWLKIEDDLSLGLSEEKIALYFDEKISPFINQESRQPKIELSGERVSVFEPGQDGLKLDYSASIAAIYEALFNNDLISDLEQGKDNNLEQINLISQVEKIEKINSSNELGIFELIGTGHSNFAGSSANRRHNIKVGADKLHGLVIKPGEEFSLVNALGKVDRAAGYLEEYVIKGNKTVAEYGGGLCQIATTLFRSAMGSGLPITERRNHSYRVSYYEPAGVDATVYSPRPDLKFKNDTGNNILIQARFEGYNDIYFDFWGKSDGRLATITPPVIYNIVRPGPTKIIETSDLEPGKKRCTESAHAGADTYFDYTVIYNYGQENENKVETRFHSKYVPWREVCLLGVEKKEETETEENQTEAESEKKEEVKDKEGTAEENNSSSENKGSE